MRRATKAVSNNGFNPVFPDGDLGDFAADDADACFLRVAVMDDDTGADRLAAVCCLPVAAVRAGVRHVPLWDARGGEVPYAGVLCRFHLDPPPPPRPPLAALTLKVPRRPRPRRVRHRPPRRCPRARPPPAEPPARPPPGA